jgi:hypothetical protein
VLPGRTLSTQDAGEGAAEWPELYDLSVRILDTSGEGDGRPLTTATVYLTPGEARQLAAYLSDLADDPVGLHHSHLLDEAQWDVRVWERELTVAVYVDENLDQFDSRSRRLIDTGE